MKMEDNTRESRSFYSLGKGDICLHNGEAYIRIDANHGVLLTKNHYSDNEVGDIVDLKGTQVDKVNAKIVIESLSE